jgi:hypothetical protein
MLTHHEPSTTTIDYASLSPEQRAAVVQNAIRHAHAERAKVIGETAKAFVRLVAFWRHTPDGHTHGTSNATRHA